MLNFASLYFYLFAALTAAGGLMGYLKAHSMASLIAGVSSGLLLAVAGYLMPVKTTPGIIVGLVTSLLLLGRFLPAYLKKGAVMPAVPMIILSSIAILLSVVLLVRR
ncbi:MAG: TMEM14 family protein [Verrucomicrobiota bacterium]